jgi:hypothetical protein
MPGSFEAKRRNTQIEFNNLMDFANAVATSNPDALRNLVRLYLRPLQSEMLLDAAGKGSKRDVPSIDSRSFFWEEQSSMFSMLRRTRRRQFQCELQLNRDIILPWPWHRERLIRSLSSLGRKRAWGRWKQDEMNHHVHVWLPWGIAFVAGGNHSIAAGIIEGEGKVVPTEVHDMSAIFRLVECDGMHFIDKRDGRRISLVNDARTAAVFEIGRLMRKFKVSAW